jgi:hypothetical protein
MNDLTCISLSTCISNKLLFRQIKKAKAFFSSKIGVCVRVYIWLNLDQFSAWSMDDDDDGGGHLCFLLMLLKRAAISVEKSQMKRRREKEKRALER